MMIVLFEDDHVDRLAPVTLTRPAFAISCGGQRLVELVERLEMPVRHVVRPHLQAIQQADFPDQGLPAPTRKDTPVCLLNARLVPSVNVLAQLERLLTSKRRGVVRSGDSVCAAIVDPKSLVSPGKLGPSAVAALLDDLPAESLPGNLELLEYPHDIVRYHVQNLSGNLEARIATADRYKQTGDGVFLARGASISPHVVTDTREGPIVLEEDATVGAFCHLHGPLYLERDATVREHATIRGPCAAGHTTRLGGEISRSIIEPYSNKAHFGFLGHSYVGSWVNLGAGTTNSNLKNTYGVIQVEYEGRKVSTGMQFLGCLIGDYAKSAINVSIFTGKTIGVGSMLYGFVAENVPAFVNYARTFGQATEVSPEVAVTMQAHMFARRGLTPRPADIELLRAVHEMTAGQRTAFDPQLRRGPLSFRGESS